MLKPIKMTIEKDVRCFCVVCCVGIDIMTEKIFLTGMRLIFAAMKGNELVGGGIVENI